MSKGYEWVSQNATKTSHFMTNVCFDFYRNFISMAADLPGGHRAKRCVFAAIFGARSVTRITLAALVSLPGYVPGGNLKNYPSQQPCPSAKSSSRAPRIASDAKNPVCSTSVVYGSTSTCCRGGVLRKGD
jgi:hypothetical protein